MQVSAFGCRIPLYGETGAVGVREVAVDVHVPKAGWIGVGFKSSAAATLHGGGQMSVTAEN